MTDPQTQTLALTGLRDLLGLGDVHSEGGRTDLAPAGRRFTLTLVHEPAAPLRPQPTLGLYHFALLLRPAIKDPWGMARIGATATGVLNRKKAPLAKRFLGLAELGR